MSYLLPAGPLPALVFEGSEGTQYNVGVGIADVTGPAAGIVMMGYGHSSQASRGIHIRLFSRAFIFENVKDDKLNRYIVIIMCNIPINPRL